MQIAAIIKIKPENNDNTIKNKVSFLINTPPKLRQRSRLPILHKAV